jgi:hypothetical protein
LSLYFLLNICCGFRNFYRLRMTSLTSTNVFTISWLSIEPSPPPTRSGKFSSTTPVQSLAKSLLHYSSTIRTIRRLFADYSYYSSTIRGLFVLFADYSYYSSTIRGLFVLFVDYSHYSLHYSSFINLIPLKNSILNFIHFNIIRLSNKIKIEMETKSNSEASQQKRVS